MDDILAILAEPDVEEMAITDITTMSALDLRVLLFDGHECTQCVDGAIPTKRIRNRKGRVIRTHWAHCAACDGTGVGN